jgi:cyclophilin family peptidyl-prolyl cis-trans isomerase
MWRLLHNRWVVFGGMGVIAASAVFSSLCATQTGSQTQSASRSRINETATPEPSATATPDPNASPTATPAPTATPVVRRYPEPPPIQVDAEKQYFATIKTDKGDIRVQLFPKEALQAVNTFVTLARGDYYDGLAFHRVIDGLVAQAGDAGSGAPGFAVPVEPNSLTHDRLALALARNNATGQLGAEFYITLAPLPSQNGKDTVFGKVVGGQQVLEQLTRRNPERQPNAPPGDKILDITIDEPSS